MSTKNNHKGRSDDDDYLFASKALLMPHIDQLITKRAENSEYYKVLNSILHLLNSTDTFNSYDHSSIFFSLTQLLTTSNVGLKRYLMILLKQINTDTESIMITQQILNEINSDKQFLKSTSLRLLLSKVSEDMLPQCTPIVGTLLSAEFPSNAILSAILYFDKFYPLNTPTFELYKTRILTLVKETHRLEKDDACSKAIQYYFNNTRDSGLIKSILPVAKSRNLTMKTLLSIVKQMMFSGNNGIDIELIYKITKAATNSKFCFLKYKGAKLNLSILKLKGLTKDMQLDLQKQTQEIICLLCNGDNIQMDCGIKLLNALLNNMIKGHYTTIIENKFNLYFATNPTVSQVINTVNLKQSDFPNNLSDLNSKGCDMTSFEIISIIIKYNFLFDVDDGMVILKEIKEYLNHCTEKQIQTLLNEIIDLRDYFWKLNTMGLSFIVKYLTHLLEIISKKTGKVGSNKNKEDRGVADDADVVDCVSTITTLVSERSDFDLLNVFENMLSLNNKMVSNIILDNMCSILTNKNKAGVKKSVESNELKEKILRWLAETYLLKEDGFKENIIIKFKRILKTTKHESEDNIINQMKDFVESVEEKNATNVDLTDILVVGKDDLPLNLEALTREIENCEGDEIYNVDINKFCYELRKHRRRSEGSITTKTKNVLEGIKDITLEETKTKEESEFVNRIKKRTDLKDDMLLNPDFVPISNINGKISLSGSSIAMKYSIGVVTNKKAFLNIYIENKLDEELISDIRLKLNTPQNIQILDQEMSDQQLKKLEIKNNMTVSNNYLLNIEGTHLKLDFEFTLNVSFKTTDALTPDSVVLEESYKSRKISPQNVFLFKLVGVLSQIPEVSAYDNENDDVFEHEIRKKFKINKDFDIGIMFNKFGKLFKEMESKYESFETNKKYYTEDFMGNRYLININVKDIDEDYNKVEIKVRSNDNSELNDFFSILDILNI